MPIESTRDVPTTVSRMGRAYLDDNGEPIIYDSAHDRDVEIRFHHSPSGYTGVDTETQEAVLRRLLKYAVSESGERNVRVRFSGSNVFETGRDGKCSVTYMWNRAFRYGIEIGGPWAGKDG